MVASAMALVSCVEEVNFGMPKLTLGATEASFGIEGGDTTLTINATRDWSVVLDEETAKWIAVNPASGMASLEPQNVMVTVLSNSGYSRQADVKFTIGMMSRSIAVSQAGELGSVESLVVYENDFDKEVATQTYGSGTSWPYLDQFEGWKNQKGTGAENVSFAFKGMSARANSTSDSNYSDYPGSGNNNMFFGASAYLATHGIALGTATDFELTFGSEKYSKDNGSIFTNSEFHIWLSADGKKWVELKDYTFAGGETEGRWNVATANFSVPEGTSTLSICISVDVASSYRMDDMKLVVSDKTGTAVDFSKAVEKEFGAPANPTPGTPSDTDAIYSNNFDASAAAEGDKGWPYLDQSEVWKNEAGSGAANVSYASSGVSVRNNANSNGSYSDYAGSGVNNIFFGKSPYFAVKNIALGGATNLELTFGTEKYSKDNGSLFTNSEFHIWLSADGNKWVEFTDYTYAGGTTEGRWNLAKANFTVPAGTENLSICFAIDVASSYRIDDLKLVSSTAAGTAVDFSQAVEKDFNAGSTGGGNNDGGNDDGGNDPVTPPAGDGSVVTIAEFISNGGSAIEGIVISNMDLNNLTSKKGMYIQDETAGLQFYLAENHSFAFGDKVRVDLTGVSVGEYNGAVQVSGLALSKITKLSSGNTVTPKTVTIADFLANKYEGQYVAVEGVQVADADLGKTFVMNGSHTSIAVEDANGNTFVIFSSKYASYGTQTVPQGSGTLKGISSISKGQMQIIFTQASDFAGLTGTRFDGTEVTPPADGGDDVTPPADGDDDPVGDADYEPNITWTLGNKAYDNTSGQQAQTATVNGVEVSNLLKLGTGSLAGDATLHVPAGTKKLGFYCVAWKGKTASVKFSIGGTEITTITPNANAGATGNPPYVSITVTDADYFEVEMPSTAAADVKVETLDPANGRVLFIGLKAIK